MAWGGRGPSLVEEKMMPIHDWTRVDAGIFHAFHHRWISAISDVLNTGLLPSDFYALPEQMAAGFGPDVLTLQDLGTDEDTDGGSVVTAKGKQSVIGGAAGKALRVEMGVGEPAEAPRIGRKSFF
jgi:hypothetical protein